MRTFLLEFSELRNKVVVCLASATKFNSETVLSTEELQKYHTFKSKNAANLFILGRYCAKSAYLIASGRDIPLNQINVINGVFGQPVLEEISDFSTSISHSYDMGGAIVFERNCLMGIDICCFKDVTNLLSISGGKEGINTVLTWAMQEALSKAIHTGITVPIEILKPRNIQQISSNLFQSEFINFPQYRSIAWVEDTYVVAVCYPKTLALNSICYS